MKDNIVLYKEKLGSAAQAAARIASGSGIWIDIGVSQPKELMAALGRRAAAGEVQDLTVHTLLDVYEMPWYSGDNPTGIRGVSWFSGGFARQAVNRGIADVMPCYYRDIPSLAAEYGAIDCICLAASPMDSHGYFSLGPTSSAIEEVLGSAKQIILEVNRQMPRALRGATVHISEVSALCESDYPLPVAASAAPDEVSEKIGGYIADEIPDGATIQLGIGAIPDAVGTALKSKHHLGIHTELFTDSMVELIACGAADNSRKPLHRNRSVAAFAYGSKRIYDYVDDNPAVELLPVSYVNDPKTIAAHPDFISVNSAIEVDFFGQVCAESAGTRLISGTGGQADYVRGAVLSPGGKSFIAFPSTAKDGSVSRICSTLSDGAVVSTGKNDVDYIVTEYGIAKLRGKTLSQRTKALIGLAHPKFRDALVYEAKKRLILI